MRLVENRSSSRARRPIGLATARLIASEGASRPITVDLAPASLECADCGIEQLTGDVADESFWSSADLGRIDHAVINARIAATAPVAELDFAEWRQNHFAVNLDGAFLSTALPPIAAICNGGSIVSRRISSRDQARTGHRRLCRIESGGYPADEGRGQEAAARRRSKSIRLRRVVVETPIWDAVPMFADRGS